VISISPDRAFHSGRLGDREYSRRITAGVSARGSVDGVARTVRDVQIRWGPSEQVEPVDLVITEEDDATLFFRPGPMTEADVNFVFAAVTSLAEECRQAIGRKLELENQLSRLT
jgi:hypothetical protein